MLLGKLKNGVVFLPTVLLNLILDIFVIFLIGDTLKVIKPEYKDGQK